MAATLDQDPDAYSRGSEIPESWYVILFGPFARQSALAPDGHATTGDFLPPMREAFTPSSQRTRAFKLTIITAIAITMGLGTL